MRVRTACRALLAACAVAAASPAAADDAMPAGVMSVTPQAKFWLRMYPLQPYAEYWRLTLKVPDLKKALPKVVSALEKNGGSAAVPLANSAASPSQHVQQLSYRVARESAGKAVKALQALGEVETLNKAPGAYPGILEEVRSKLQRLRADADSGKEALGRMPAVSEAVGEILEHLDLVAGVHAQASERVLLNLELREGK